MSLNDRVVKEFPLYLTAKSGELDSRYLTSLQFPLAPSNVEPKIISAKYRKNHKRLEIKVIHESAPKEDDSDDDNDVNFNDNLPPLELIMRSNHIHKKQNIGALTFKKRKIDVTDNNSNSNNNNSNISCHIAPIDSILQIRPCFRDVKRKKKFETLSDDENEDFWERGPNEFGYSTLSLSTTSNTTNSNNNKTGTTDDDVNILDSTGGARPRPVIQRQRETERMAAYRSQSYMYHYDKEQDEAFCRLRVHKSNSYRSGLVQKKVMSHASSVHR